MQIHIQTHLLDFTPKAQIFLALGVPTSNHTPVSPSDLSPFNPYSLNVRITASSKSLKYL